MKIACSSASFAQPIEAGTLTQLEWLDVCANELEVDGVVLVRRHFPRADAEYLAQVKKLCTDLGLSVAAIDYEGALWSTSAAEAFEAAIALGAPILIATAAAANDDSQAWGVFTEAAGAHSRVAKGASVTLAVRNAAATLCSDASGLRRLAKDVDSAWLRFAPNVSLLAGDDAATLLPKSVIASAAIGDASAIASLQRFRGFISLDGTAPFATPDAYHRALGAFRRAREETLIAS